MWDKVKSWKGKKFCDAQILYSPNSICLSFSVKNTKTNADNSGEATNIQAFKKIQNK